MQDHERVKLIAGPYRMPRCRIGGTLCCARYGKVIVRGISDAPISWPYTWAKDKKSPQINARADTAATKPMFRAAFKKRRCLIAADGYYEWKTIGKAKQPYYHRLKSDEPFTFAGMWEWWKGDGEKLLTCAILTTDANELAREI
ncbi:MAG TPA: SOS response-associated peptidase [Gemmataceae bacterium]|nr:SOS response-associated peptidase [Gemmataceae bacterium]